MGERRRRAGAAASGPALAAILLGGCGQSGPLYLPEPSSLAARDPVPIWKAGRSAPAPVEAADVKRLARG